MNKYYQVVEGKAKWNVWDILQSWNMVWTTVDRAMVYQGWVVAICTPMRHGGDGGSGEVKGWVSVVRCVWGGMKAKTEYVGHLTKLEHGLADD